MKCLFIFIAFNSLLIKHSEAQATAIVNLDNAVDFPENTVGEVFEAFADVGSTAAWAIAATGGCTASLDTTTTCGAGTSSCKIEFAAGSEADYESAPSQTCSVTVDGVTQVLTINVQDQDDVEPDTTCTVTAVNVDENDETVQGTLISACSSPTAPLNFNIYFDLSVSPTSAASKFTIDSATGDVNWASTTLNNNFEVDSVYTLTVTAYTGQQTDSTPVDITVTVDNVNEAPIITNLPQTVYIDEDYPRYSTYVIADVNLLLLEVYDEDNVDVSVTQIFTAYILSSSCNSTEDFFQFIASGSDQLQLTTDSANAFFDFENTTAGTCNQFELEIYVQDAGAPTPVSNSSVYNLTVVVMDKDEVPWFNRGNPSSVGYALETTVDYPKDRAVLGTTNGRFYFSESKNAGRFSGLNSSPGSANTDGIYIADLDDYFQARQYFDPDCSPLGTCAGTATFQIVTTGLLESYFEIRTDGSDQRFYLYLVDEIDYEVVCEDEGWTSSTYTFKLEIVGIDNTGLQTTNSIDLYMALTDDNEYDPVMDPTHNFSIAENSPYGTNVGATIICQSLFECHADIIDSFDLMGNAPSASNDGDYYFEFQVSNVGQLSVLRPPDYELVQQVVFNVECVDYNAGEGDRRTSTTLVTVDIIDQNDNEPEFVQTFFSLATRYDTEFRTFLTRLESTDLDSGLNAVPVYATAVPYDEFGIDSRTGDVYTKGVQLIPFHRYIIYGVVYDTGEPGQAQNIGKNVATIRVDAFDAEHVLIDLYLGISWDDYNATLFKNALDNLMQPYVFFIQQNIGGVSKDNVVSDGVKVTVYAISNNETLLESHLAEDKLFVSKETLLKSFLEYADGTPSELFQSPEIVDFGVRHVETSPIDTDFQTGEGGDDSWLLDEPEGNFVFAVLILFTLVLLALIIFAFFMVLKKAQCYMPSGREYNMPPAQQADNKLLVGKLNKNSISALAREQNQVVKPTATVYPAPEAANGAAPAPQKNQLVPVVTTNPPVSRPPPTSKDGGRKIWEIRKSREGNVTPLA